MWGDSGNLLLRLSHNQEEVAAYNEAVEKGEDDLPDVTCYVRVGQPRIVYGISESVYDQLTAVSYRALNRNYYCRRWYSWLTKIFPGVQSQFP